MQTEEETEVISKQQKLVSKPREEDGADLQREDVKRQTVCLVILGDFPVHRLLKCTHVYYCIRRLKSKQTPFPGITIIISRSSLQTKRL